MEETGVLGENHRPVASLTNFNTESCVEYPTPWAGFELTPLVVVGTDCTGSCKSNYHTIMTTTTLRDTKEMNKIYDFQSFLGLWRMIPGKLHHLFNCLNIAMQTKYLTTNNCHNYRLSNFCLAVDGSDYFWRSNYVKKNCIVIIIFINVWNIVSTTLLNEYSKVKLF